MYGYSDPYGLSACPVGNSNTDQRTTNVDDCDAGELKDAFVLLRDEGGKAGADAISAIVASDWAAHVLANDNSRIAFSRLCPTGSDGACSTTSPNGISAIYLESGRTRAHAATPVVQEVSHLQNPDAPHEDIAQIAGFTVWGSFSRATRATEPGYEQAYQQYSANPRRYIQQQCRTAWVGKC